VSPDDPEVREHVCDIVRRVGAKLREKMLGEMAGAPRKLPPGDDQKTHAASARGRFKAR